MHTLPGLALILKTVHAHILPGLALILKTVHAHLSWLSTNLEDSSCNILPGLAGFKDTVEGHTQFLRTLVIRAVHAVRLVFEMQLLKKRHLGSFSRWVWR